MNNAEFSLVHHTNASPHNNFHVSDQIGKMCSMQSYSLEKERTKQYALLNDPGIDESQTKTKLEGEFKGTTENDT